MSTSIDLFTHKRSFTIGVEEEYMLCDPVTGDLVPLADSILAHLDNDEQERFSYELIKSEIEINTPIAESVEETMGHIRHFRQRVRNLGEKTGFCIGISGTHPTALGDEQQFVDSPGYQWVANQLHYYARRNITFAMHVHIALPDAETAIAVTNSARRWLAPLLALSANSPFFRGRNTGMLSARTFQFGAFPRTNIPGTFRDFDHFRQVLETYLSAESIYLPRQIWWKIRPHAGYGTVEFRVSDMQRSLARTRMLVALGQAICHRIVGELQSNRLQQDYELEFLNDALWKATRFGFDAKIVDPSDNQIISMAEFIEKMASYAYPSLMELGTDDITVQIEEVLARGSEAQEQLEIYNRNGFSGLKSMLMDTVEFGDED